VKVAIDFSAEQLNTIAAAVVSEMERQGRVMVQPERLMPYGLTEVEEVLGVKRTTLQKWVEAGRLHRVPGTKKLLFTASSVQAVQKGEA